MKLEQQIKLVDELIEENRDRTIKDFIRIKEILKKKPRLRFNRLTESDKNRLLKEKAPEATRAII